MIDPKELRIGNWKPVLGSYYANSDGEIFNRKTGKFLKPQDNGNGYKKVTLNLMGQEIQQYVHRIIARLFVDNPRNEIQVNHIDGVKSNNKSSNLEWVSNSENQKHAHTIGLKKNGNELWNGKFSRNDLRKINELDKNGVKRYLIAKQMGCAKSTISDILNRKRYKVFALTGEEL